MLRCHILGYSEPFQYYYYKAKRRAPTIISAHSVGWFLSELGEFSHIISSQQSAEDWRKTLCKSPEHFVYAILSSPVNFPGNSGCSGLPRLPAFLLNSERPLGCSRFLFCALKSGKPLQAGLTSFDSHFSGTTVFHCL